jgi:hypothetical protein
MLHETSHDSHLAPSSDIIELLVLEHQMHMINLISVLPAQLAPVICVRIW